MSCELDRSIVSPATTFDCPVSGGMVRWGSRGFSRVHNCSMCVQGAASKEVAQARDTNCGKPVLYLPVWPACTLMMPPLRLLSLHSGDVRLPRSGGKDSGLRRRACEEDPDLLARQLRAPILRRPVQAGRACVMLPSSRAPSGALPDAWTPAPAPAMPAKALCAAPCWTSLQPFRLMNNNVLSCLSTPSFKVFCSLQYQIPRQG